MKWFSTVVALLSMQMVMGAPQLMKRASTSEVCPIGYCTLNGGTKGGAGGSTTTVTTLKALIAAVKGDKAKIVILDGKITGNEVVSVGANTSLLGNSGASLVGVGLRVNKVSNVIIRNIAVSKVLASAGDAVAIQASKNVWIDHMDLSSDVSHDKDFYDGLLDVTHGCSGITLSNNYIHDHWKASLVGHSDSNGSEDAALRVTYYGNHFENLNSRGPSFRFGQGHLFNNYYTKVSDGINTRKGAKLLVENNVWVDSKKALYSTDAGFATASGNDFGDSENTAKSGGLSASSLGYKYTLTATAKVAAAVKASAGATIDF